MIVILLVFQTGLWLCLFHSFVYWRNGSIYHPLFYYLVFHGLVFVIRPILEYTFKFDNVFYYMHFYPTDDEFILVLILTSVALIEFFLMSWFLDSSSAPRYDRPHPAGFTAIEWQAFWIVVILLAPVALYSVYYNMGSIQNVLNTSDPTIVMSRDLSTGVMGFTNTTGYIVDANIILGSLALMYLWGMRFRLWAFIPLLLYLMLHAYLGWGRWTILLTTAAAGLLLCLNRGYRWVPWHIIFVIIPVMIGFQQLGENRQYFQIMLTGQSGTDITNQESWIEQQDNPDFANFDFLTYVVDVVPDKSGTYSYFTQYLQLFTEPIPRILWTEKPYGPPISLVNLNNYGNFTGMTTSIIGDGWISFGWIGVVVTIAIVSYLTVRMHRWFWRGKATNFKILTYCIFVPLTVQWYRDGGISIAKFLLFTIGTVILWKIVLNALSRSAVTRQTALRDFPPRL